MAGHPSSVGFTVVIPVHCGARFLDQALASVSRQSLAAWECVIVDDASTDESNSIATAWAADQVQRVRVLRHPGPAPRGVAESRNHALRAATAPWIAFLDQDDIWTEDKLAAQDAFLQRHPELTAVGCFPEIWFDGVQPLDYLEDWATMIYATQPARTTRLGLVDFVAGCPYCLSGVVASRAALLEDGGFDPSLPRTSDWMMWARMASRGPLGILPRKLVTYRVHGGNEMFRIADRPLGLAAAFLEVRSRLTFWLASEHGTTRQRAAALVDSLISQAAVTGGVR